MSDLSKKNKKEELTKIGIPSFPLACSNLNEKAVEKVNKFLPELHEKTRAFGSENTQTTLSMMTLTMLNGHSPYRLLRQILCEVERRKLAINDQQVCYAKTVDKISSLINKEDKTRIEEIRLRSMIMSQDTVEQKINGAFKDIAILIDQYENIKKHHGIIDWDEEAFEREEKLFHVRRGFELMYRNLIENGTAHASTIEYNQQFGIHPQVCLLETMGYIKYSQQKIEEGDRLHCNDLENFLDEMAVKYLTNVDLTCQRIFGTKDIHNYDYMYKTMQNSAR